MMWLMWWFVNRWEIKRWWKQVQPIQLGHSRVDLNSALKRKNYGVDNSNRTSHSNVGDSIGSSGETFKKTPGQRNSRTGLQKKLMHQTNPLSHSGVVYDS